MNPNKEIKIEKLTLNVGTGKDQAKLQKALTLLETVSKRKPIKCTTDKRIQTWGIRKGLPIGCKVTVRGEEAAVLLKRLLQAKDFALNPKQVDQGGNLSFGIHEYIDIQGMEYVPEVGVMGLEATVTLTRNGYRVKKRQRNTRKVGKAHRITQTEALDFITSNFNVNFGDN